MDLLYALLILLVVTRICSEVATRLGQPALVGELTGGIVIGLVAATFFSSSSTISLLSEDEAFQGVLDLAVFFLMLLAGVEMRPRDLARASSSAIPIAFAGMIVPLLLGFGLGWLWFPDSQWKLAQSLFLGVALAITAVPVAVKVLMDLGQLESPVGRVVVAAAVMDDVFSLVLLAILTSLISSDQAVSVTSVALLIGQVGVFFVLAWLIGWFVLPRVAGEIRKLNLDHVDFTLVIAFGLALAVLAELLGMHFLIGAFTAGVFFTRSAVGKSMHERLATQIQALTLGFLAPVFFASIGIHLDLNAFVHVPLFLLTLIVVATVGKLVGASVVARLEGFDRVEAVAIGAAMNARGAVELVIADLALRAGLFMRPDPTPPSIQYLFSAVVVMAIVTTISSPLIIRWSLRQGGEAPERGSSD